MDEPKHHYEPFGIGKYGGYITDPTGRTVVWLNEKFVTMEEANRIGNLLCSALNGRVRP